ncbi:MAG TPA: hypothetical protein VN516_02655, partial [Candidatus Baltobacteraceae bacterium]|nr:hypothetical protein [Candidatus Baltobacteraceae bacterium]
MHNIARQLFFGAIALNLFTLAARADVTNSFAATANAYVYRGSSSSDQDESQAMLTKRLDDSNTRIAYVRFNVAAFLTNFPIVNITSARLRLYNTGGAADTVKAYGLNNTNANGVP